jgi:cellulose synthase/poly-beta-1,6-N-acetylglucosamine synthase-like glycosyltransferase
MIHIIITAYKETKATIKACQAFLEQKLPKDTKIIVADPFPETEEALKKEFKDKVEFFLDPGEGKSYALNVLFEQIYSKNQNDIIILSDGDVHVSPSSVKVILEAFKDKKIGCVTCKPVSINPKDNMYGYWSHLLFAGIDKTRKELSGKQEFFECSGYLFAIRNGVLQGFPMEASEDSIIPHLFWEKGFKIKYVPEAEVYVLSPQSWLDWKRQKIRNIKGHENLNNLVPEMKRTKSFWNEVKRGTWFALTYPRSFREFFWTLALFYARLHIYLAAFWDLKLRKKAYQDGWRAELTNSTRPLD